MLEQLRERTEDYLPEDDSQRNAGVAPAENALAFAAAVGMGLLARNALKAGWRVAADSEPPQNPASYEVSWREALLWGALSGAVVGVARIASRRASSTAYRSFTSS